MQDQATRGFAAGAGNASAARRWARTVIEGRWLAPSADVVCLVVSELVTNAVVHAEGLVQLSLTLDDDCVTVAVSDRGAGTVVKRHHDAAALGGRGLQIIETLAVTWGARTHPDQGKTVWATVRLQSGG